MAYQEINGYEVFQDYSDLGFQIANGFAEIRSDAGQGYHSSALLDGADTGTKNWKLVFKNAIQTLNKVGYYQSDQFKYVEYVYDFFCRHKVSGAPFVLFCHFNKNYYLADFSENNISLEMMHVVLWSTGLSVVQRRLAAETVFDLVQVNGGVRWYDASQLGLANNANVTAVPELIFASDTTAPTAPTAFSASFDGTDIDCAWVASEDEDSGIDHYEISIDFTN